MTKATTKHSHLRLVAGTDLQPNGEASHDDENELAVADHESGLDESNAPDYSVRFASNPIDDVPYRHFLWHEGLDKVKFSASELLAIQNQVSLSKEASRDDVRKLVMTAPIDAYGTTLAHILKFETAVTLGTVKPRDNGVQAVGASGILMLRLGVIGFRPEDEYGEYAPVLMCVTDPRKFKRAFPALKRVKRETLEELYLW